MKLISKNEILSFERDPLSLLRSTGVKMVNKTENTINETESGKKRFNVQEIFGKLSNDIDTLAKKTGEEASKLAKNINSEIKALPGEIKSIDVKNEVKNITARVEKLAEATGESAKKLATDIKTDVRKLVDKIESSASKKK
jgi:ElaB/YqjD/DUF883 family membrane-anchored ribosome-binding protein